MHNLTQYFAQFSSSARAQGRAFYAWAVFAAVLAPIVLILIWRIGPVSGQIAADH